MARWDDGTNFVIGLAVGLVLLYILVVSILLYVVD